MGSGLAAGEHWFSTDRVLIYASFCADFGPMNLAHGRSSLLVCHAVRAAFCRPLVLCVECRLPLPWCAAFVSDVAAWCACHVRAHKLNLRVGMLA